VTVVVGEGGTQYEPEEFRLAVGGTVEWVWEGNGHNVIPTEQPDGANWEGTAGSNSRTYDTGHEYTRTFDVAGEYAYRCFIHGNFGMVGSFTVE
jgi:Plastocyanin